jgi:hypothetical protein
MNNPFLLIEAEDKFITSSVDLGIKRQGLYPSEASVKYLIDGREVCRGTCIRAAYYRALKYEPTNPGSPGLMSKANIGKWDEQGIIDRWKKMGIWIDNNIKFFDSELVVSGELDAVIKEPNTNRLIGYEIKTYYGNYANQVICGSKGRRLKDGTFSERQQRKTGRPKPEQFLQAVYYSHFYVTTLKKLDEYRMYYLERGDGHRVEFLVGTEKQNNGTHQCWYQQIPGPYWTTFDPERVYEPYTIEMIHNRYKTLLKYLREKELPPRDYTDRYTPDYIEWAYKNKEISMTDYEDWKKNKTKLGDWNCSYCSFQKQCERDEERNSLTKG